MRVLSAHPLIRLWTAAGRPAPLDPAGQPIPRRKGATHCAATGGPAEFGWSDAYSTNFYPATALRALVPYLRSAPDGAPVPSSVLPASGRGAAEPALCEAAVWAARCLALRCCPWVLLPGDGERVRFCPSRRYPKERAAELAAWYRASCGTSGSVEGEDCLGWLLQDRPAGTLAAFPAAGISHGGEGCLPRTAWPDWQQADPPLTKLQSLQVAGYVQPSPAEGVLALQVDGQRIDLVCAEWRVARPIAEAVLRELGAAKCGVEASRGALLRLEPPPRCPPRLAAQWAGVTAPLRGLARHPFWPLFVDLLRA